jgi:hypothetical protein
MVDGVERVPDRTSCRGRFHTRGRDINDNPSSQGALKGDAHSLT